MKGKKFIRAAVSGAASGVAGGFLWTFTGGVYLNHAFMYDTGMSWAERNLSLEKARLGGAQAMNCLKMIEDHEKGVKFYQEYVNDLEQWNNSSMWNKYRNSPQIPSFRERYGIDKKV